MLIYDIGFVLIRYRIIENFVFKNFFKYKLEIFIIYYKENILQFILKIYFDVFFYCFFFLGIYCGKLNKWVVFIVRFLNIYVGIFN